MTALKKYQRLESTGVWRPTPKAQRQEVLVSFGDATLVISDTAGRPLSHWSLSTIEPQNAEQHPMIYIPAPDAPEELEIDDQEMITAIEKVRTTIERARSRPGRLRWLFRLGIPFAVIAGLYSYGPDILMNQALSVVPPSKRAEFGSDILARLEVRLGKACDNARGAEALKALAARLLPDGSQIAVLPRSIGQAIALPGSIIVLDQSLIETGDDPHIVAGHVIAATQDVSGIDPLEQLLLSGGTREIVNLLTTGEITETTLDAFAETIYLNDRSLPPTDRLINGLLRAEVAPEPFLASQGINIVSDGPSNPKPVLSDGQMVQPQQS